VAGRARHERRPRRRRGCAMAFGGACRRPRASIERTVARSRRRSMQGRRARFGRRGARPGDPCELGGARSQLPHRRRSRRAAQLLRRMHEAGPCPCAARVRSGRRLRGVPESDVPWSGSCPSPTPCCTPPATTSGPAGSSARQPAHAHDRDARRPHAAELTRGRGVESRGDCDPALRPLASGLESAGGPRGERSGA
jgi:hypothetical protein